MQAAVLSFNPSKKLIISFFIFLSVLLAAYTPMAAISSAQSAIDTSSKLQELKTKALDAINERIKSFQTTLADLSVNVTVSKSGASASVNTSSSTSPSPSASPSVPLSQSGLSALVDFPGKLEDQAKDFLQKIVDELTQMKGKVTDTSSLTSMQSLASNLDAQSGLNQLANVQGAVTQAVQSLTGVFGNLSATANNLQSRVSQLSECSKSGSSNVTQDDCAGLNTTNSDVATSAQSQMDNIGTIMSTISSVLMTAITLLTTLITSFSGLTGGLGSLGSLGNISNLSNLTSLGDISSLTGGLGGISGLLTSFTGLSSQLDIANGMSGNVGGLLGNLSSLVNV